MADVIPLPSRPRPRSTRPRTAAHRPRSAGAATPQHSDRRGAGLATTDISDHHPGAARPAPLVAVCALHPAAGATTLAYLLASAAARQARGPVLLADIGDAAGALATLARTASSLSLTDAAQELAAGRSLPAGLTAHAGGHLRLLATTARFQQPTPAGPLARLLAGSRSAHAVTVIDCGTASTDSGRVTATTASHIVWLTTIAPSEVTQAARTLAATRAFPAQELLVARRQPGRGTAPIAELRVLAAACDAPLVLLPHIGARTLRRTDQALERCQVSVQAILGALTR